MKEELKQKMIGVIGESVIQTKESIAEKCAQIAVDHYEGRKPALSMSGVSVSACSCDNEIEFMLCKKRCENKPNIIQS